MTFVAVSIVTIQSLVPEQPAPLQPVNTEPLAAAPVSVTTVPSANEAEHVVPQSMPARVLLTVPVPVPSFTSVSVN